MKKLLTILFLVLSIRVYAATSVTGTVTDSDTQTWNYGTWSARFSPSSTCGDISGVKSFAGILSSDGSYSMTIDSDLNCPNGQLWSITACPDAGNASIAPCANPVSVLVKGTSQTANLSVAAPRFGAAYINFGYSTNELTGIILTGWQFWDGTTCQQYYSDSWNNCPNGTGNGTVIDGSGTTTPNEGAVSTSFTHEITYVPYFTVDPSTGNSALTTPVGSVVANSPSFSFNGVYYNGTSYLQGTWSESLNETAGTNGNTGIVFTQSGSSGHTYFELPANSSFCFSLVACLYVTNSSPPSYYFSNQIGSTGGYGNIYAANVQTTTSIKTVTANLGNIEQNSANSFAGSCSMSAGTSCTITIGTTYNIPICIVTQQSATLTGTYAGCTVTGTTVTITAGVANSEKWGALVFGNPN